MARSLIHCDTCGRVLASAPSLDEMLIAVPVAFRPMLKMIPGGVDGIKKGFANLFRCTDCMSRELSTHTEE